MKQWVHIIQTVGIIRLALNH